MTEDELHERRFTGLLPPIRQGYRKITDWSEVDYTDPDVLKKLTAVYQYMYAVEQKRGIAQPDLTTRSLPWIKYPDKLIWTCDQPPHRGTVQIHESGFGWQGCVESLHQFK